MERPRIRQGRSYQLARHHAWGGLAFLSLVMVLRILFPDIPGAVVNPLIAVLLVYVLVWLCLTYRYRTELKEDAPAHDSQGDGGRGDEKARAKVEKKRIKAELKARKKGL